MQFYSRDFDRTEVRKLQSRYLHKESTMKKNLEIHILFFEFSLMYRDIARNILAILQKESIYFDVKKLSFYTQNDDEYIEKL